MCGTLIMCGGGGERSFAADITSALSTSQTHIEVVALEHVVVVVLGMRVEKREHKPLPKTTNWVKPR